MTAPADLAALLDAAVAIAHQAGAIVREAATRPRVEMTKGGEGNVVTDTDHAAEKLIVGALAERFPDHGVVAEEGSRAAGEIVWLVDPLDGTNNFAHGYPFFAVNLAAVRGDEVLVGVTYDPLREELFSTRKGGGAWLNEAPIRVSTRERLAVALVATGFPYDKATNPDNNLAELSILVPEVRGLRRSGSAALDLAYVACGRLDAYWERGTQPWDLGPGVLLIAEAGGTVTDYDGSPLRLDAGRCLVSNGLLHEAMIERLAAAR